MGYGFILLAASIVLAYRYATTPGASRRSKWVVGGLVAASLLVPAGLPRSWGLAGTLLAALLQVTVAAYVLLYQTATSQSP
jgi:hypothetical protein